MNDECIEAVFARKCCCPEITEETRKMPDSSGFSPTELIAQVAGNCLTYHAVQKKNTVDFHEES